MLTVRISERRTMKVTEHAFRKETLWYGLGLGRGNQLCLERPTMESSDLVWESLRKVADRHGEQANELTVESTRRFVSSCFGGQGVDLQGGRVGL